MTDWVSIELHSNVAESVSRIVKEYRMKQRTGLTSYERTLLRTLEEAIAVACAGEDCTTNA